MGKAIKYVLHFLLIILMVIVMITSIIISGIFSCRFPKPIVWQMTVLYATIGVLIPGIVVMASVIGLVRKYSMTFIIVTWLTVFFLSFVSLAICPLALRGTFVSYTDHTNNFGKWDRSVVMRLQRDGLEESLLQCSSGAVIRSYSYFHEPGVPGTEYANHFMIEVCFVYGNTKDYQNALKTLKTVATGSEGKIIYLNDTRLSKMISVADMSNNIVAMVFYGGYSLDLHETAERLNQMAESP